MSLRSTNRINAVSFLVVCLTFGLLTENVFAQSNYASQANNVEYQGEGLPKETTLDGKVSMGFLILFA